MASGRLYYLVRLRNFLREPVTTTASLAVASDFADMFEVRGGSAGPRGDTLWPRSSHRGPPPRVSGSARIPACAPRPPHSDEAAKLAAQLPIFVRGVSLRGLGPEPET